jgi:HTH-type transcriptional regulator/antitoxin HigA
MLNTKAYEAPLDNVTRLIADENELEMARAEMGRLLEIGERTTTQDNRLGVLAALIRYYEDQHWALEMPDPVFAIQSRMDDLSLHQSDMLEEFGNKTTASQIMNRKRFLTLPIIRRLAARLGLPIAILTQEYTLAPDVAANRSSNSERLSAIG